MIKDFREARYYKGFRYVRYYPLVDAGNNPKGYGVEVGYNSVDSDYYETDLAGVIWLLDRFIFPRIYEGLEGIRHTPLNIALANLRARKITANPAR